MKVGPTVINKIVFYLHHKKEDTTLLSLTTKSLRAIYTNKSFRYNIIFKIWTKEWQIHKRVTIYSCVVNVFTIQ